MSAVDFHTEGHVGVITLNEPDRGNAITPAMLADLPAAVAAAAAPEVRAVVVAAAGRHFCTGADFTTMPALLAATGLEGEAATRAAVERLYAAFTPLYDLDRPTIAAVQGAAIGGGLGIALLCDLRIVAREAKLAANFTRLGIHAGLGITQLLIQAVGYEAAAELLLVGEPIRGDEAVARGLALRAVAAADVAATAMALAQKIAANAPLALRYTKRTMRAIARRGRDDVMDREAAAQALLSQTADAREGVMAMIEKRTPRFRGG